MRAVLASITAGLLLAACGGGEGAGGGETLFVALRFPITTIPLFHDTRLQPVFTGLEGHAPSCQLTRGRLPTGMAFQGNCSITGRPVETGTFPIDFRVTAEDADGAISSSVAVTVFGPTVTWPTSQRTLLVGIPVNVTPRAGNGWTAPPGTAVSWSYAPSSGSLPPGLSFDLATGVISGVPTVIGSYSASFKVVLTTAFGTYEPPAGFSPTVSTATFDYTSPTGTNEGTGHVKGFISQPFVATPRAAPAGTLSGFSLGAGQVLPPGLVLNPATGTISGTPTGPATRGPASLGTEPVAIADPINATFTLNGGSVGVVGGTKFWLLYPVRVSYPFLSTSRQALTVSPLVTVSDPRLTILPVITYSPRGGECSLPPGTILDPSTGKLTGTPTATGSFNCTIDLVGTNNGISWSDSTRLSITVL